MPLFFKYSRHWVLARKGMNRSAKLMVKIGRGVGREVTAVISDMSQPLGRAVGNALEI